MLNLPTDLLRHIGTFAPKAHANLLATAKFAKTSKPKDPNELLRNQFNGEFPESYKLVIATTEYTQADEANKSGILAKAYQQNIAAKKAALQNFLNQALIDHKYITAEKLIQQGASFFVTAGAEGKLPLAIILEERPGAYFLLEKFLNIRNSEDKERLESYSKTIQELQKLHPKFNSADKIWDHPSLNEFFTFTWRATGIGAICAFTFTFIALKITNGAVLASAASMMVLGGFGGFCIVLPIFIILAVALSVYLYRKYQLHSLSAEISKAQESLQAENVNQLIKEEVGDHSNSARVLDANVSEPTAVDFAAKKIAVGFFANEVASSNEPQEAPSQPLIPKPH